ncbi:uncharacterized protein AC631_03969 [Debaryomyces fabryi]|uniref:dolichol kinase n=1 Tax=Debaryomyces fabryi TaxID=58627 RepID=A0A0V1PVI2_9ASCO|nr:uncharacterized protein AC631_03969 [Debaryomyces fabryi]KSA00263.1 hypothetical protein AC631_03969 [Debaryomyces fabryi]CUM50593.1 unnamed protein product [Debaryomyces fabryi]
MPPRKNNSRGRSSQADSPATGVRSTAAIFANPGEKADGAIADESVQPEVSNIPASEESDDPSSYSFPLNYIFRVQDFLNDNLDLCKFVQLLVVLYISEVLYLTFGEHFWNNYAVIGFNLLGLGIALILGYQAQLKKHVANPGQFEEPELPEFNHIYSVFIPLTISFLLKLKFFLVNLALNNFIIDGLHPIPKFISAVMFFEVYNEDKDITTFRMIQITFMHYLLQYIITSANSGNEDTSTYVSDEVIDEDDAINLELIQENNDKKHISGTSTTLNKAEIQLLCLMVTNLLFGLREADDFNLPLTILQKLIISLIISLVFIYPLFKAYENWNLKIFGVGIIALFSSIFAFVTNYLLAPILSNTNAISWLWNYITESEERVQILSSWGILLLVSIPAVFINSNKLSLNSRRKVWHYIILVMIAYPSLPKQPIFTIISLLGSIVVFIILEIVRYNKFTILGEWLYKQLVIFQDFKDLKGPLNLSYIFLIIGVTIPIVFDYCIKRELTCKSFIGIIGLGIGDSSASVIGKHFGSLKWKGSSKSVQGTAAFIFFSMAGFYVVDKYILTQHVHSWENLLVSCILGGVLEGVSNLNDNFLIPSVMYISLQALDNL